MSHSLRVFAWLATCKWEGLVRGGGLRHELDMHTFHATILAIPPCSIGACLGPISMSPNRCAMSVVKPYLDNWRLPGCKWMR